MANPVLVDIAERAMEIITDLQLAALGQRISGIYVSPQDYARFESAYPELWGFPVAQDEQLAPGRVAVAVGK